MLSIIGDRVTAIVLPFAVLSIGGKVGDVAIVSAAQFLPFAILALPAGVWADRLDRKKILITSDAVRFVCQLTAAIAAAHRPRDGHPPRRTRRRLSAPPTRSSRPAFTGLLPGTVAPVNMQPANALIGLSYSTGSIAGPVLAAGLVAAGRTRRRAAVRRGRPSPSRSSASIPLRPRTVRDGQRRGRAGGGTDHFLRSLRDGWSEVRSRSWVLAFLGGMASYHAIVLPAIFVLGPVLVNDELGGAKDWAIITAGFGIGSILGDILLLHWRPRFALRVAALMLMGASCQAAFIGSGLGVWAIAGFEVARRRLRDRQLHAVGDLAAGARARRGPLAGLEL